MSCYKQFWTVMNCSELLWTVMNGYEQSWAVMNSYAQLWTVMNCYEQLWTVMNCYELLWTAMNSYEQLWTVMNSYEPRASISLEIKLFPSADGLTAKIELLSQMGLGLGWAWQLLQLATNATSIANGVRTVNQLGQRLEIILFRMVGGMGWSENNAPQPAGAGA